MEAQLVRPQWTPPNLGFSGTLREVIRDLEFTSRDREKSREAILLQAPRIIRAAVDYKIGHPNGIGVHEFVNTAVEAAVSMYRDSESAIEQTGKVREALQWHDLDSLLDLPLVQPGDGITARAMDPALSLSSATSIYEQTNGGPVLFIALGHGGVAAGLDVFTTYDSFFHRRGESDSLIATVCRGLTGNTNAFYVARLSMHKLQDSQPRLTEQEITYLKGMALGRHVVVFDEDRATGLTLKKAEQFFNALFGQVIVATNLDARYIADHIEVQYSLKPSELHSAVKETLHYIPSFLTSESKDKGMYDGLVLGETNSWNIADYLKQLYIQNVHEEGNIVSFGKQNSAYSPIVLTEQNSKPEFYSEIFKIQQEKMDWVLDSKKQIAAA